jgi:ketosteroid isomerase-like protein
MKLRLTDLALAGLFSSLSAFAAVNKEPLKAELVQVENAFCALASQQGVLAAFAHFAAPDAAFFDVDPREQRGAAAVQLHMADWPAGAKLTWTPSFVDVAESGDLGYTWGRYEFRGPGADGKERIGGGFYLTIWKRQPDGTWKFVVDTGTPDRPKPSPAAAKPSS